MKCKLFGAACVAAAVFGAPAVQAEDLWGLEAFDDVCPVSFGTRALPNGMSEIRHHADSCRGGLDNIAGWSDDGDGAIYFFYDRAGQVLGRVEGVGNGLFAGIFGDGAPLSMRYIGPDDGTTHYEPDVIGSMSGSGSSEAQDCRLYYGTGTCAEMFDIGEPDGAELMPIARLNVRFSSNLDSRIIATVDRGECLEVTRCRDEPFEDSRLWCEVQLEDRSGWVLKQDEAAVYSLNICR